jgi:hypothetical protein
MIDREKPGMLYYSKACAMIAFPDGPNERGALGGQVRILESKHDYPALVVAVTKVWCQSGRYDCMLILLPDGSLMYSWNDLYGNVQEA